ncbi:MAG: T9SS type A sorting domain-containing protein [Bacteroidales bacterium]|nr:T9SS type A sorting domain-containing protein [Bacteroidales bacterium]
MTKNVFIIAATLLLGLTAQGQGSFCGAVGTEGCNAVSKDSSAIVGWATGCVITRGPQDIAVANSPVATYGSDHCGIGPAEGIAADTSKIVSLGDGGTALLTFASPIQNGPGPDLAVFENSFNHTFLEMAFVEVSTDGEHFVRFPATSLTQTGVQINNGGAVDPTNVNNLAGKFKVGYGTPFDLEELRDSTGIDIDSIVYVRLVDVVGSIDPQYGTYDAYGHIINDPYPTPFWSSGFDLDGVAVLHQRTAGIGDVAAQRVLLSPNPASTFVNVSCAGAGRHSVVLCDASGRRVLQTAFSGDTFKLDISTLDRGVYVLLIDGAASKLAVSR